MLSGTNQGFGKGWRISESVFDASSSNPSLILMSGERIVTDGLPAVGDKIDFLDKKLVDVVAFRVGTNEIKIIYLEGTTEILEYSSFTHKFHLSKVIFENGEQYEFERDAGNNISKIKNTQNGAVALELNYDTGTIATADSLTHDGKIARQEFMALNREELSWVSTPYEKNNRPSNLPLYIFSYTSFDNEILAIEALETPGGGRDEITYNPFGHQIDNNLFIPHVVDWIRKPGFGQKNITRRYTYSSNNFTGFPVNGGFREGVDNLYFVGDDYVYTTTEEVTSSSDNATLKTTTSTFNNYHLLVTENVRRGDSAIEKRITYNVLEDVQFPGQPANFQMPSKVITEYKSDSGASREEVLLLATDDHGNETARTEPSGIIHETVYFPVEGEEGLCPPEPHGIFIRYKKKETALPAYGATPPRVTDFTYSYLDTIDGESYFIVPLNNTGSNKLTTSFEYVLDRNLPELHGKPSSVKTVLNGFETLTTFEYEINGNTIAETRKILGHDGSFLQSKRTVSSISGLLYEVEKEDSSSIIYEYDISERLVSEVLSPDTEYKASRLYEYGHRKDDKNDTLTMTDALNGRYVIKYDGFGRRVSSAELVETSEVVLHEIFYDEFDRVEKEVRTDKLASLELSLTTKYEYNNWGERNRTIQADGAILVDDFDPIKLERTEGLVGLHPTVSNYNEFNQIKLQTTNRLQGIKLIDRTFDGFGRCVTEVLENSISASYTFDEFDRIILKSYRPVGDVSGWHLRVIKIEYAPYTSEDLIISQRLNNVILGTRVYDGVGRLKEQSRGSNTAATTWSYDEGSTLANNSISPRGVLKEFTYNANLRKLEKISLAGVTSQEFNYNKSSGLLEVTDNQAGERSQSYDSYGRSLSDSFSGRGRTNYNADYMYSPAGRLLQRDSALDGVEERKYDEYGRLKTIVTGDSVLNQFYDRYGRVEKTELVQGSITVTTKISYSPINERESMREVFVNDILAQVSLNNYHLHGRLFSRSNYYLIGDDLKSTTETYHYDHYFRISRYSCDGDNHPEDSKGRKISSQEFTHDSFNNITNVTTQFVGGQRDVCERRFEGVDPTQLTSLSHTNPPMRTNLTYDASGNLKSDGFNEYIFDELERLIAIVRNDQNVKIYEYDAEGRQISQSDPTGRPNLELNYDRGRLANAMQMGAKVRLIRDAEKIYAKKIDDLPTELNVLDETASVKSVLVDNKFTLQTVYTPYGMSNIASGDNSASALTRVRAGFNGEIIDSFTNLYHLGRGRRPYSPELMIFLSPDPLSPFDQGGINAYAYCHGDPVNFSDPSGLVPIWSWILTAVGLLASILSLGFATAGAVAAITFGTIAGVVSASLGTLSGVLALAANTIQEIDKKTGWDRGSTVDNLNIASLFFGVSSVAAGISSSAYSAHKVMARIIPSPNPVNFAPPGAAPRYYIQYSPGAVGRGFKAGFKEFGAAIIGLDDSYGLVTRTAGAIGGALDLSIGLTAIGLGVHSEMTPPSQINTSSASNPEEKFNPSVERQIDPIATIREYSGGFDEAASRLRQSAIFEMYD
jgi:RHS repeat-associated protein